MENKIMLLNEYFCFEKCNYFYKNILFMLTCNEYIIVILLD